MAHKKVFSKNIEDKVFLVTGGAAGIGAGVVRSLLTENARFVAFVDIAEREGSALETELNHHFGHLRSKFIKCDISDEAQLSSAYNQIYDKYRRLDGVINNAAVLSDNEHYKRMISVNLSATVGSTLKALDVMGTDKGAEGGCIVNVSSLLALAQNSHLPVYAATKTAILQFSNCMGNKDNYKRTKVRVMTACLGPTDTAIFNRYNLENFEDGKSLASRVPIRQRVESAATGIMDVIKNGDSGSTWIVASDKPAFDISNSIKDAFDVLSQYKDA